MTACASPPASKSDDAVLAPDANLLAQSILPILMSLVARAQQYTAFRGHGFVEWHPQRSEMLVTHRKAGDSVTQIHRLDEPLGELEQLTHGAERVSRASYEPRNGRYIVFQRSKGGTRAAPETTLWAVDPLRPRSRRKLVELQGTGWYPASVSDDDRTVALVRYRSANESQVWLLDVAGSAPRQVLPAPGENLKATHLAGALSKDGKRLLVTSDRAGEFRELMSLELATGGLTRVTAHIPRDVDASAVAHDGRWLVAQVNHGGREELRLFDASSLKELAAPALPVGSIGGMDFHRATHQLAYAMNTARGPSQIYVLDPNSGRSGQWTRAHTPAGVDTSSYADRQVVRWKSFDGLQISGLHTRPAPRPIRRRARPGDAGFPREDFAAEQCREDQKAPVRGAGQERSARTVHGKRADRRQGTRQWPPVWYLRGENEGHGFARQENSDFLFYARIKFAEQTLLK